MRNLNYLNEFDLLSDWLGWEVYEELDTLIDQIYEAQQNGLHPDLTELKAANKIFRLLWLRNRSLEDLHEDHEMRIRNHEVLLLAMTILWGAGHTIKGLNLLE